MNELESLAAKLRAARRQLEREPPTVGILAVIQTLRDLGGLDQAGDATATDNAAIAEDVISDYGGGT